VNAWSTACLDWQERLLAGRSLVPPLPLFEEEAQRAVRVFNRLRLPDVIGKPRIAEATGDWFRDIVMALFGSYDAAANYRHVQEVFLLVPKKNGKSTNAAAVMVTAAIVNRRPEAELLLVAPTKEIADISFRQANGMVAADDDLKKLFQASRHTRTLIHRVSGAVIKIIAADTDAVTGAKATFTLIDETHVFATKPKAAEVFVELRGALAARPDGFLFQITTQSKTPPAGVFKAELETARRVRDGEQDLPLLPVLYELPAALRERWKEPRHMALVNPNFGKSVNEAFLERELAKAEREGVAALALFGSQHANVQIGLALKTDRWAGADFWEACAEPGLTLDDLLSRSEVVVVGIDGGGLDDLLGLAVIGRESGTGRWLVWAHAWAHEIVLERRQEVAPKLRDLEKSGDLTIVKRPGDDLEEVADVVERIETAGLLAEENAVGVDQAGIDPLVEAIVARKIDEKRVVGIQQGWTMMSIIKTSERKLAADEIRHGGTDLMNWAVGNAKVEPRGNAVIITKQAAGSAKIDPLMAFFDAATLMGRNPKTRRKKYQMFFLGSGASPPRPQPNP
jgi:phage terminase large subunit-like protein